MIVLYLILHLLAGVCFGLAAAGRNVVPNTLALGLLFWVLAPLIQFMLKL